MMHVELQQSDTETQKHDRAKVKLFGRTKAVVEEQSCEFEEVGGVGGGRDGSGKGPWLGGEKGG